MSRPSRFPLDRVDLKKIYIINGMRFIIKTFIFPICHLANLSLELIEN